jgi:CheY-like chemotaxis protein
MPGMSGLQVLRKLKTTGQLWRVVVITAHDEPETREQCLNAGACAYLRKPLEDRLLLNAISAAMRSHPTMIKR